MAVIPEFRSYVGEGGASCHRGKLSQPLFQLRVVCDLNESC